MASHVTLCDTRRPLKLLEIFWDSKYNKVIIYLFFSFVQVAKIIVKNNNIVKKIYFSILSLNDTTKFVFVEA